MTSVSLKTSPFPSPSSSPGHSPSVSSCSQSSSCPSDSVSLIATPPLNSPASTSSKIPSSRVTNGFKNSTTGKVIIAVGRALLKLVKILSYVFVIPALLDAIERDQINIRQNRLAQKLIREFTPNWDLNIQISEKFKNDFQIIQKFKVSKVEPDLDANSTIESLVSSANKIVSSNEFQKLVSDDPFVLLMNQIRIDIAPLADGLELYRQLDGEFIAQNASSPKEEPSSVGSPSVIRRGSLSESSIVVENNREGGHKYHQAMEGLWFSFCEFTDEACGKNPDGFFEELEKQIKEKYNIDAEAFYEKELESPSGVKNFLLLNLYCVIRAIHDQNPSLDVRQRNQVVIAHLRNAYESQHYQLQRGNPKPDIYVKAIQKLCVAKYTEVYPFESAKGLVEQVLTTNGNHQSVGNRADLNVQNVASVLTEANHALKNRKPELSKSWGALAWQKLKGTFNILFDPTGGSNVPGIRSKFTLIGKEIGFCRFGTPTIQFAGRFTRTEVDPIFLCALETMKRDGNKQFLYVNHQKPKGREANRYKAIAGIEKTHDNLHFLSIPLDGKIVEELKKTDRPFLEIENLIVQNFLNGENGCQLPAAIQGRGPGFSETMLRDIFETLHNQWGFDEDTLKTREGREAFWGVFNTLLKHRICIELKIDFMNSACKDNKDRGGTLSSIDEAVRNVMLGKHNHPNTLKDLIFNALAPFSVKLEEILDEDTDDSYRLGYLRNVLKHIAKMDPVLIGNIQKESDVTGQSIPRGAKPESPQPSIAEPNELESEPSSSMFSVSADPEPKYYNSDAPLSDSQLKALRRAQSLNQAREYYRFSAQEVF